MVVYLIWNENTRTQDAIQIFNLMAKCWRNKWLIKTQIIFLSQDSSYWIKCYMEDGSEILHLRRKIISNNWKYYNISSFEVYIRYLLTSRFLQLFITSPFILWYTFLLPKLKSETFCTYKYFVHYCNYNRLTWKNC